MYLYITRRNFLGLIVSSAFFISTKPANIFATPIYSKIKDSDMHLIFDYAYRVIDHHFDDSVSLDAPKLSRRFPPIEYKMIWVSFLRGGETLACRGMDIPPPADRDTFLETLRNTVELCLGDRRFVEEITAEDVKNIDLVIYLNENIIELSGRDIESLSGEIELGVHSIHLELYGGQAWYLESVPITNGWGLEATLQHLAHKAGLPDIAYRYPDAKIERSDMSTFFGKREGKVNKLYRYNILISEDEISQKLLYERLELVRDWFLANVNRETKRVEYLYDPITDTYSEEDSEIRNLAVLYIMGELNRFFGDFSLDRLIKDTTDHYVRKLRERDGYYYVDFGPDSNIAHCAFMILSLINLSGYQRSLETATGLAECIISLQKADGSYQTSLGGGSDGIDYYPGESMLSLMRLYEVTKDERLTDSVKRAFPYYRDYWRNNRNTAFVPWHTQVYFLFLKYRHDREMESFVYEMSDWIIDTYQIFDDIYPDKVGGFKKEDPRNSTSSYMEGINDAYATAVLFSDKGHIRKYRESIRKGIRFVLQTQFTKEDTFWLKNPKRAIGGFRESLKSVDMRNDYTQHATSALLKTFHNNIFS